MSFWDNKLNGTPTAPQLPSRDMFTTRPPFIPPVEEYKPTVRVTEGSNCPGCGSGSYGSMKNAMTCFECGYNPRFQQTGYGTPSLRVQPGTRITPARQTNDSSTIAQGLADIANGHGIHA